MNDKLKQSLDGRLGGMRWGERDQAEVFRQIQRKELQDVKHVKRGTGALAIAIALLFVVMGAAFALNHAPQPEDQRVAVQPTDTAILPISTALYENEYFTLTIDSSTCTASEAAFTGTIRMKNPADTMLSLASHTPPGDAGRTRLPVNLSCGVSTQLPGDMPMACGSLRELDVLSMTADTTVFRMSGEVAGLHEDVTFTLWINWTDPADSTARSGELTWSIAAPEQPGMLLAEYDLVTVRLADYSAEDGIASLALDVTPAKPWYVLNRQEEGKATLTVSAEPLLLYPTFDPQDMLGMVDAHDPIAGEMPVTLTQSPEGLRLIAEGPLPAAETLYGYVVLHVYSDAAEAHYDEGFDDHYYEVCVPVVPLVEAVEAAPTATPAPLPQPTATPAPPVRSEPTGEHIGGTDTVSVYLEESWYDGFSADATLRIRAHDAADKLAVTPNLSSSPSESTWVVQVEGSWNDYYQSAITPTLTLDAATGDVLVHLIYRDRMRTGEAIFNMPLTMRVVNEKTWQTETEDLSIQLNVAKEYPWHPLHLVESDAANTFIQAGYIITDRYTYIGVMRTYSNEYPAVQLTDEEGSVLASDSSSPAVNTSIERSLFPVPYTEASQATASVLRLEGTEPLPETLRMEYTTQKEHYYLMHYVLSTTEPQDAPQQVESMGTLLSVNDVVSVYLVDSWYDGFSATATLRVHATDPHIQLAIAPNQGSAPSTETYVTQLSGTYENHYVQDIVPTLTLDEATGDMIIQLTYMESHMLPTLRSKLNLPVTLTLINEQNWQRITTELDISIVPSGTYPRRTLYLIGGEHTDNLLQASCIITDRYTYIGVMRTYNGYTGIVELTDGAGNVLASTEMTGSYSSTSNVFFNQPANTDRVAISYLRIDSTQPLPEAMHVRYPDEATDPIFEQYPSLKPGEQPHFILSPTKPGKTR